ncbi:MAG: pilus assembly protein PilM, partial [Patescibacteria group bacterium]
SNPFIGAFGLDIGDLSIKLIQLERRRNWRLQKQFRIKEVRSVTLPAGYIVGGEIQQPEMVRQKLLYLLGKDAKKGHYKKIASPYVVVDLPEPKTFLKLISIDLPQEELTEEDVFYQAKKHLPFELEETYLDWQFVSEGSVPGKSSRVLIGAAPKTIADSYTYLLESVGLSPVALEIEALSLVRALITAGKSYEGEARGILDLGATRSSFIVYDEGTVQFSTSLTFSGELVNTALIQGLKIDYLAAEELKIKNGLTYDPKHPAYLKIVSDLVEKLAEEISRTLLFYKQHFSSQNPITHLTLGGGMANFKNLDNILSRKLKIAAHPGQAFKNLGSAYLDHLTQEQALTFVSAIGLSLRAAHNLWQNNSL